jgi:conjugative relaxase-like TrwC/TraI family protein
MIRTSFIKAGEKARVEYYLLRAALDEPRLDRPDAGAAMARYYGGATANGPGRWMGRGADSLGLTDQAIAPDDFRRAVMEGHVDGGVRAKPELRRPPETMVAAEPFAVAVRSLAESRGIDPTELFSSKIAKAEWGWVAKAADRFGTQPVETVAKLGRIARIDPEPLYGDEWGRAMKAKDLRIDERMAGVDTVMSADKTVSMVYALGDEATREVILHEFNESCRSALGYLDGLAATAVRGSASKGTAVDIETDGILAVSFTHDEARPTGECQCGDPHLHQHVIVLNTARGSDGEWSAIQHDLITPNAKTAGHLHEAELRARLTERLGVNWRPVVNGLAGVEGITDEAIRHFSKRSNDIEAEQVEAGTLGKVGDQAANHAHRQAKREQMPVGDRHDYWTAEAAGIGVDIDGVLDRGPRVSGPLTDAEILAQLTNERSSFSHADLIRNLADSYRGGAYSAKILARADAILDSHDLVIALDQSASALTKGDIRRGAGGRVYAYSVTQKWTTPEMLDLERELVDAAVSRQGTGVAKLDRDLVEVLIDRAPFTLSAEQANAVRGLTTSGNGVDVLHAGAGSGKTSAVLGTVRQAYEASGYRVIGATTSAKAARVLSDDGGLDAATIASTLIDLDRGGIGAGTVLVLDEASMIGTRNLAGLLAHAQAGDAKLVVVGDTNQLAAIDAGGGLRGLRDRLGAYTLTANRRQREPWEQVAVAQIAHGEPGPALRAYQAHERVTVADTALAARRAMVADWWSDVTEHGIDQSLMVAVRNVDRNDLNTLARGVMWESGRLSDDEVMAHGRTFAVGDRVMLLHNLKPRGLDNGDIGTVTALDENRRLVVELDRGQTKTLPVSYAAAGHVDYAYCATVYKAQGATVETTRVLGTALAQESGYVALSRGKGANHLYLAEGQGIGDPELDLPSQPTRSAYQAASRSLRASQAKTLALDTAAWGEDAAKLRAELAATAALLRDRPASDTARLPSLRLEVARREASVADARLRLEGNRGRLDQAKRKDRPQLAALVDRQTGELTRMQDTLAEVQATITAAERGLSPRETWERDHGKNLESGVRAGRELSWRGRAERKAQRAVEPTVEIKAPTIEREGPVLERAM